MKGTVYGIFPVETKEDGEIHMSESWINDYLLWLFKIMMELEGIACVVLGIPHRFIIKIKK